MIPSRARRTDGSARLAVPLAVVAGALLLVLAAAALLGLSGRRSVPSDHDGDLIPVAPTTTRPARSEPGGPSVDEALGAALGATVRLSADQGDDDRFPGRPRVIDGLPAGTVLRLRVDGFERFTEAVAQQCVLAAETRCGNAIPVQFGDDGVAAFQYLVTDDFVAAARPGRCRPGTAPCSVVVEERSGGRRATVGVAFHDRLPPPGRIQVTPRRGLVDGQVVRVAVEGYPPGAQVQAMLCSAPAVTGGERCGSPGPVAALTVDSEGRGATELTVRAGPVGSERAPCRPGATCGVSVASPGVYAHAPVVPIAFAGPPGADYDATRLAVGLAVAALLVGVAAWIVRRSDWGPIGEEAAPSIDEAAYADLDAIVAALPPEEDPDEILSGSPPR